MPLGSRWVRGLTPIIAFSDHAHRRFHSNRVIPGNHGRSYQPLTSMVLMPTTSTMTASFINQCVLTNGFHQDHLHLPKPHSSEAQDSPGISRFARDRTTRSSSLPSRGTSARNMSDCMRRVKDLIAWQRHDTASPADRRCAAIVPL